MAIAAAGRSHRSRTRVIRVQREGRNRQGSSECNQRRLQTPLRVRTAGGRTATAARIVHGTAAHASRERTADVVELPSRYSIFVTRKEAAVVAESSFEGRAVVAANDTGRSSLITKELVGDGSGGVKRSSTARNCTRIHGRRGGNRGGSARVEDEDHRVHRRPCRTWKPDGGVRRFGDRKYGDPREDGQQIEHRRDEVRRKPR